MRATKRPSIRTTIFRILIWTNLVLLKFLLIFAKAQPTKKLPTPIHSIVNQVIAATVNLVKQIDHAIESTFLFHPLVNVIR